MMGGWVERRTDRRAEGKVMGVDGQTLDGWGWIWNRREDSGACRQGGGLGIRGSRHVRGG